MDAAKSSPSPGSRRLRWTVLWVILIATVLLPFLLFERQFEQLATWLAEGHASGWATAAAIGALLALDVFLPVPSSIVSTGAGVLLGFWKGTLVIWIGMNAGCAIGYLFGAYAAAPARRLVGSDGLARAGKVMEQYGLWAMVVCRPIPVLAESSVVFAGLVKSPLAPFLWLTTLADLGIALAYAAVGAFSMRAGSFLLTFAGAIALPGVALLAGKIWLGRRGRSVTDSRE
ncbi:MAG: VTT domain-containing protein [Acidobacteriota bacterium]